VGVLLGLSSGAYAILLAGATTLQASSDAVAAAARQPMVAGLAELASEHDRLEAEVEVARNRYVEAATAYASLEAALDAYEARLDELAARVGQVQLEAGALPGTVPTPRPAQPVTMTVVRQLAPVAKPAPKPATSARTGASGK
jgi:hypothetical protein